VSLQVAEQGRSEPALLLLHGFGGSKELWTDVVAGLPPGRRTIAPDLRGFGGSPGAVTCIDDHLDDLAALARERALADYVVVGHSMGGKLAAAHAARRPVGLRAVALIASSPLGPEPMEEDARAMLLNQHGDPQAMEALVDQITCGGLVSRSAGRIRPVQP
jgi:pimeloyl-ACP methyl ester carboxylesterase